MTGSEPHILSLREAEPFIWTQKQIKVLCKKKISRPIRNVETAATRTDLAINGALNLKTAWQQPAHNPVLTPAGFKF